jgi:diguanylate cyclase (GGDEF)-like protein
MSKLTLSRIPNPLKLTGITNRQARNDMSQDALTGLATREMFINQLESSIRRAGDSGVRSFAVLLLGIDRFQLVNDSLGHAIGNELLVAVSRRLRACLRSGATVSRLCGDEFAALVDGIKGEADATRVANRIQRRLSAPFSLSGQEVDVTVSIGIALLGTKHQRPEDILQNADLAVHSAKARGGACCVKFETGMRSHAVATLQLESGLRRAAERGEFRLYFQPIASLNNRVITGAEALLRWQHPQRGLISAGDFVPLAEETGLIVAIGEWVLRTACAQAQAWHSAGHSQLRVTVNLSARQLEEPNHLTRLVRSVLRETGLSPRALELEITESVAVKDVQCSEAILGELSADGIRISLDDFGTGCSTLRYLTRFPIDTLKIDQSFVRNLARDVGGEAVTSAVITMAQALQLKVVAEGVETEEQLEFLLSRRCDEMQGYLFSRPLPAETFARLLKNERITKPHRSNKNLDKGFKFLSRITKHL